MRRVLALALVMSLTACGAPSATSSGSATPTVSEVAITATAAPTSTPTPTAKPKATSPWNARGNVVKGIGEPGTLVSRDKKTVLLEFTVTAIEPNFQCTNQYAQPSQNGNFIAISLEIETKPELGEKRFDVGPHLWKVIGPDGVTENDSMGSGAMCLNASERIPSGIGSGERLVGQVVLDSKHTSGVVVLAADPGSAYGWEWSFA